ncbi:hypothetical protein BGZ57DRAFT_877415 [Hyaloscypha finlandica]|nr:hypothetical protein BGZ57DRAFT_877415 [Hyaloscypha finlandica]
MYLHITIFAGIGTILLQVICGLPHMHLSKLLPSFPERSLHVMRILNRVCPCHRIQNVGSGSSCARFVEPTEAHVVSLLA